MSDWLIAAQTEEIAHGKWKVVSLNNIDVAIINLNNQYYAFEDACTHTGCPFVGEEPLDGDNIVCPWHGARFEIKTGKVLTPPADEDLNCFATKVMDNKVYVNLG